MDLLNILVPHKNQVDKLERLLKSIPVYINTVVVDDFSDEKTYNEVSELIDKYENVKLIRNLTGNNNAGVSRNLALENSNSAWVIFADADDEFITNNFSLLISKLTSSSADVIFYNVEAIKEEDKEESIRAHKYKLLIEQWPNNYSTIAYSWVVPWGKAIRRNILDSHSIYFESRHASNDIEFSVNLASKIININVLKDTLYRCYESRHSLTATITPEKAKDRLVASCNANIILFNNKVSVHYNYNFKFLKVASPLLLRQKDFSTLLLFLKNLRIASIGNLLYK